MSSQTLHHPVKAEGKQQHRGGKEDILPHGEAVENVIGEQGVASQHCPAYPFSPAAQPYGVHTVGKACAHEQNGDHAVCGHPGVYVPEESQTQVIAQADKAGVEVRVMVCIRGLPQNLPELIHAVVGQHPGIVAQGKDQQIDGGENAETEQKAWTAFQGIVTPVRGPVRNDTLSQKGQDLPEQKASAQIENSGSCPIIPVGGPHTAADRIKEPKIGQEHQKGQEQGEDEGQPRCFPVSPEPEQPAAEPQNRYGHIYAVEAVGPSQIQAPVEPRPCPQERGKGGKKLLFLHGLTFPAAAADGR